MRDRRTFLAGLAALPVIAGAAALFHRPSSAATPADRARKAWDEFSAAMRDLTANADGWCILGAADRWTPLPKPYPTTGAFLRVASLHYETEHDPRFKRPLVVERHQEIAL